MISLSRYSGEISNIKIDGEDEWKAWLRSQKLQFHYQLPIFFKETSRGLSIPPLATTSGTLACGSIPFFPLPLRSNSYAGAYTSSPFYHESGPMLVGAYLFPPFHDIRHLPAGDSKSRILLCKESTSRMIFEEIYMIDLFFYKLNHSFFLLRVLVMRTVITQCFSFPNLGVKHCS